MLNSREKLYTRTNLQIEKVRDQELIYLLDEFDELKTSSKSLGDLLIHLSSNNNFVSNLEKNDG